MTNRELVIEYEDILYKFDLAEEQIQNHEVVDDMLNLINCLLEDRLGKSEQTNSKRQIHRMKSKHAHQSVLHRPLLNES
jgi:hypothetical protein